MPNLLNFINVTINFIKYFYKKMKIMIQILILINLKLILLIILLILFKNILTLSKKCNITLTE